MRFLKYTLCFFIIATAVIRADTSHLFSSPSDDRWHYPFNFTPGDRPTGSMFGTVGDTAPNGQPRFNDRDGVLIFGWDTTTQIAPGQGSGAYRVKSLRITITSVENAEWLIDLTPDEWFTYDANADHVVNADGIPRGQPGDVDGESNDADPGRPFELFGAGFAPDSIFDELTWTEHSPFIGWNQQASPVARNPFPFVYQDLSFEKLHCEDNVKGLHNDGLAVPIFQFTPRPWATGAPVGYTPGATPTPFDVVFDVDLSLSCGSVHDYFADQLNNGRIIVTITSLFETFQQAPTGFPTFYLNNPGGNPFPARLELVLADHPLGDMDGDNDVDLTDAALFITVLKDPGAASTVQQDRADVNGDGTPNGGDVQAFVNAFLGGC